MVCTQQRFVRHLYKYLTFTVVRVAVLSTLGYSQFQVNCSPCLYFLGIYILCRLSFQMYVTSSHLSTKEDYKNMQWLGEANRKRSFMTWLLRITTSYTSQTSLLL